MTTYFLLRFDDICPTMDWKQWEKAKEVVDKYEIKPLLGVIPCCEDAKLMIDEEKKDFWQYVKNLKEDGYTIAMHGYKHVYLTSNAGLVGTGKKSEFAGLSYDIQYEMLKNAKESLKSRGVDTDVFFAPSHSYDDITIKALSDLGFRWVSDGKGPRAVKKCNINLLPCVYGGIPKIFISRYVTVVIHTSEWSLPGKGKNYEEFVSFCEKWHDNFVDFEFFSKQPLGSYKINCVFEKTIVYYQRFIKPIFSKIKKIVCGVRV